MSRPTTTAETIRRVAASTLTFSRLPLATALESLTKLGCTAVELAAHEGWAHVDPVALAKDPELAEAAVAAVKRAGVRVIALNAGFRTSDPVLAHLQVDALADLATRLGATVLTLPAGRDAPPATAARLAPLLATTQAHGITLAVETHIGAVTEDPKAAVALCHALPGLRLTLDPSHYWAGSAQGRDWERVVPLVAHLHLRDAGKGGWPKIQMAPGTGDVDWTAVLTALRQAGYAGSLAVEYIDTLPIVGGTTAAAATKQMLACAHTWLETGAWPDTPRPTDPDGDH